MLHSRKPPDYGAVQTLTPIHHQMDISLLYPPELFRLLVDTIPLLCRSARDVLPFLQKAGVGYQILSEFWLRVEQDDESLGKDEIVRTTLAKLNEQGKGSLRQRKTILDRVTEFNDFDLCLPEERSKAQEMVSEIRRLLDIKDDLKRVHVEFELENKKQQNEHFERVETIKKKRLALEIIKDELLELFEIPNEKSEKRGILLEGLLNRLFKASDINVKKAFELVSDEEQEIKEQIEGVVEIDSYLYSVEIKWYQEPLTKADVATHIVNIFNREHAGGILISNSGYTGPALSTCKQALSQKIIVLCELREFIFLLENEENVSELLKSKIKAAVIEKKPLFSPLQATGEERFQDNESHVPEELIAQTLQEEDNISELNKYEGSAGHDEAVDNNDTLVASSRHRMASSFQTATFPAKKKHFLAGKVEYNRKIDAKKTGVIPLKNQPSFPIQKSIHFPSGEGNIIDDTNKQAEKFDTKSINTAPIDRQPPAAPQKTVNNPSEEEQNLLGREEVLDQYVTELKKRSPGRGVIKLRRLLDLQRAYPQEAFIAAVSLAFKYGLYDLARLEKIILDNIAGGKFFELS